MNLDGYKDLRKMEVASGDLVMLVGLSNEHGLANGECFEDWAIVGSFDKFGNKNVPVLFSMQQGSCFKLSLKDRKYQDEPRYFATTRVETYVVYAKSIVVGREPVLRTLRERQVEDAYIRTIPELAEL